MMTRLLRYKTDLTAVILALLCTLAVSAAISITNGLFQDWENKTLDYRFKLRGPLAEDPRIVLIDIDDESIQKIGRWPWDRNIHAGMIHLLSENGAAVIGYDILFKQPADGTGDQTLADAIKAAGNVYLPIGFELEESKTESSLLTAKREIGPFASLRQAAGGIGHISSNRDPDGTIRRVPLVVRAEGRPFPAFSLAILSGFFKIPEEGISFDSGEAVILEDVPMLKEDAPGNLLIPVDAQGMMLINYAGPWVDTFTHYAFIDLFDAWQNKESREDLRKVLQGKICLISNTATGYDLKPTPFEADYPGGGVHANALNTILTGRYLREFGSLTTFLIALILSIIASAVTLRKKGGVASLITFGLMLFYLLITQTVFLKGVVLPVLFPFLAVFMAHLSSLLYLNHRGRFHVAKLVAEKRGITGSLKEVTAAVQRGEIRLKERRGELADLIRNLKEIEGRETEKVEKIKLLESNLLQAQANHDGLMNEKRKLEKEISDFWIAKTKKVRSQGNRWDLLQEEASRYGIVTFSREMLERFERAKKVARTKEPVLVLGETGTGKELFAWAIHAMSPRSKKPFITLNIPALQDTLFESELFGHVKGAFTGAVSDKKGKFQLADGGTLFLDEVGEMPLQLQAKLLRVLQTGSVDRIGANRPDQVDVRIIAATNRDLQSEVERKSFRKDLYYRLDGVTITLLPLRKRQEDFEPLTEYLLQKSALALDSRAKGISERAMDRIKAYSWPGNIRELEKTLTKGMVLSEEDWITERDLELSRENGKPREEEEWQRLPDLDLIDPEETYSDKAFLSLLRKNRFEIGKTAEQLKVQRVAVGSRFKGICLKVVEEHHGDFERAAEMIAGGSDEKRLVDRKIREYYKNLLEVAKQFQESEEAITACRQRFKNVKKKYHPSIERLIKQYFETRMGAQQ